MSRCTGFVLVFVAAVVIGGCSPKPEPPQTPTHKPQAPAVEPVVSTDSPPADTKTPVADTHTPAAADVPAEPDAPVSQVPETKPMVLGAIGRAVAGALGVSNDEGPASRDDEPGEAPAYRPQK